MERQVGAKLVPPVRVAALAAIVEELLAGGAARLHSAGWLRTHPLRAGLSRQECEALEALRLRLCRGAITELGAGVLQWG